jgi:hypothetical protein
MPIVGQFGSLAGFGMFPGGALESIATVTVGSGGTSTISFTSIPSTYQHLQLRYTARTSRAVNNDGLTVKFNGSSANYAHLGGHVLFGNGSSALAQSAWIGTSTAGGAIGQIPGANANANVHGAGVVDFLDYGSTSKTKTVRTFHGQDNNGSGEVHLMSFFWNDTAAVTSMDINVGTGQNFVQHSTFALYGVKAP